jgi:Right handed beta helix region
VLRRIFVCSCFVLVAACVPGSALGAPTARYAYSPTRPAVDEAVRFDASRTRCDRRPCSYSWRIETRSRSSRARRLARTRALGSGETMTTRFGSAGTTYVRLTVRNARRQSASTVKRIVVSAPPPVPPPPAPAPPPPAPPPTPAPTPTPSPTPAPTPAPTPSPAPAPAGCTQLVSTASAVQSAFSSADGGEVICLANGSYGAISLSGEKASTVTVRAQNPGGASTGRITATGANIRIERLVATGGVRINQPSQHIAVVHNRLLGTGGGYGVELPPDHTPMTPNVTIEGNEMIGPFTDAMRINGYTGTDAPGHPGWGLAIVDNEITGIIEDGSHNDCLQSVWGGSNLLFEGNYVHDNRCQGFFLKDSVQLAGVYVTNILYRDNLMVRNNASSGVSANFNVYETRGFRGERNTHWDTGSFARFNSCDQGAVEMSHNVFDQWHGAAANSCRSKFNFHDNTYGSTQSWTTGAGDTVGRPTFVNPAQDDYRVLGSGRGVSWRPADKRFGP